MAQWEDPSWYVMVPSSPTKFPSSQTDPIQSGGANAHTTILSPHPRAIALALTKYSKLKHPVANTAGSSYAFRRRGSVLPIPRSKNRIGGRVPR